MRRLVLASLLLGMAALPAPASAQPANAPPAGTVGSTIDGGLPEKTGATTAVGQTKPPGSTVGPEGGTRPDLEQKSRDLDRRIDNGICTGCK